MRMLSMRRLALAWILACGGLGGQTAAPKTINLTIGRGELVQFMSDISRVAVSEPKIADAVVVSPREVMINAKSVGRGTIVVWETGVLPARYEINVLPDQSDFDGILKSIGTQLPDSQIVVTGNTETIVLTGKAKDARQAKQAEALASTHAKKVVNLLDVPPEPEPRQILLQVRFASIDRVGLSELGFNFFSRNDKTLGSLGTQQFPQPRFSQLQFELDQGNQLAQGDLGVIFAFNPRANQLIFFINQVFEPIQNLVLGEVQSGLANQLQQSLIALRQKSLGPVNQ